MREVYPCHAMYFKLELFVPHPQSICIVDLGKVCFTGREFDAKEAKEVGLISKVCLLMCRSIAEWEITYIFLCLISNCLSKHQLQISFLRYLPCPLTHT